MKSEERHRLHQNELERLVEKAVPAASGFFRENQTAVLAGAAIILVAVIVYLFVGGSASGTTEGWTEMFRVQTEEELGGSGVAEKYENLAEDLAGSEAGVWSQLNAANRHMSTGIGFMFSNRSGGKEELEQAQELFQKVLDNSVASPAARERAAFGLVTCEETLSGEDTSSALSAYEKFVEDYPDSVYVPVAEERIQRLNTSSGRAFYGWFAKQDPKPGDRATPQDTTTDPFLETLPDIPDMLKLPEEPATDEEADQPTGTAPPLPDLPARTPGEGTENPQDGGQPDQDSPGSDAEAQPKSDASDAPDAEAGTPKSDETSGDDQSS